MGMDKRGSRRWLFMHSYASGLTPWVGIVMGGSRCFLEHAEDLGGFFDVA